ncbi:A/G-specific adenine glycosylase [Cereibacter sphaeroides]|uniref:A/G-specific adenine glycosylase n=1 Tax=Cereibacter sphaeroides TaxID=1063 RepID=UPI001F2F8C51|nr:A/G-specific adenine glycosylase [Cereibacter sphaeroides]MCE6960097.1 A/G-specific adenine glycosylase [Cereibacter sphaeroides]MCE6968640.1 A/G-specific adenine glycosylase [Cereibacter sphaeroides]MCE6973181.1 A/G-specific adenine glycosylase [Cereibacter sphaeroides]
MRDIEESPGATLRLRDWYDRHARVLPWRVCPGDRAAGVMPDPYRVWLSEIMLQQTTVAAVKDYFHRFTTRWPDVVALAAAEDAEVMAEWAGLGYYARARNLLKGARAVVTDHGGRFPQTRDGLLTLPGVGPYTAAAVAAIAFDEPATVVDGNVERVVARLFRVETPLPAAKPELTRLAAILTPPQRPGDHAQAMMDLGATICTPRNPACGLCPLVHDCEARRAGAQAELPRKAPKAEKPVREGTLWIAHRADGSVLLETRPEKGMLGGMLGWPGTDWDRSGGPSGAPLVADWQDTGVEVRHTFTHFHLRLTVLLAEVPDTADPLRGRFIPRATFRPAALPTLMRKAWNVAAAAIGHPNGGGRLA